MSCRHRGPNPEGLFQTPCPVPTCPETPPYPDLCIPRPTPENPFAYDTLVRVETTMGDGARVWDWGKP